ncbi:hypothetical protein [Curtobacterium sp. NPDC089185]|uniref:hypothetical protein n=1 Tax=Curtobacterium sp. NPDC089185 TaxID=3154968 RepID=UPI0034148E46
MSEEFMDVPTDFDPLSLADWLEASMVVFGMYTVSRSAIARQWSSGQGPDSAELDELFGEVQRRTAMFPDLYPFRVVSESVVIPEYIPSPIYFMLILLTFRGRLIKNPSSLASITPAFEALVRDAVLAYIGAGARGVRFGYPSSEGRPKDLPDAVRWVAELMGLRAPHVDELVDKTDNDAGVDVIAWKPLVGGGASFSVWLVQATVQSDFQRKGRDVVLREWGKLIEFGSLPNAALCVPEVVPSDTRARLTISYDVHLFLDRLGMLGALSGTPLSDLKEFEGVAKWVRESTDVVRRHIEIGGKTVKRAPKRKPRPMGGASVSASSIAGT